MSLVHTKSCESVHTGLDLFALPPTQTAVQDGLWVEYHPLATLAAGAPIEFAVSGATADYIDLSNTYLYVKAKVLRQDGTNPPADAVFAPVNYWLHSLFFSSGRVTQQHPGDPFGEHLPLQSIHRVDVELWTRSQNYASHLRAVLSGHGEPNEFFKRRQ